MSRPLLPPRGIFVPTRMVYNHSYSPTVVHTWIQLRGLAWDRTETPQLSMRQLSEITGKSPSTLYGHLALLRSWGALRMRHSVKGTFIVTFPADTGEFLLDGDSLPDQDDSAIPELPPGSEGGEIPESRNLESPDPPIDPPVNQFDDLSFKDQEKSLEEFNHHDLTGADQRGGFTPEGENNLDISQGRSGSPKSRFLEKDSKNLDKSVPNLTRSSAGRDPHNVREGRDTFQEFELPPELDDADPVKIYQKVTGIRPKQLQREHLQEHIQDTNIWYASLKHWVFHGWNPNNITGMIQLYQRGGPSACRYCSKDNDSHSESLKAINQLREKYRRLSHDNP